MFKPITVTLTGVMRKSRTVVELLRMLYDRAYQKRLVPSVYHFARRGIVKHAEAHGSTQMSPLEIGKALLERFNGCDGDSDEVAAAFAAAAMSQGLDVVILGESHLFSKQIHHVAVGIVDGAVIHRFDPQLGDGPGSFQEGLRTRVVYVGKDGVVDSESAGTAVDGRVDDPSR